MAKVKLRAASKSQCRGRSGGSCSCGRCPGGEAGESIHQSYSVHPRRVKSDRLLDPSAAQSEMKLAEPLHGFPVTPAFVLRIAPQFRDLVPTARPSCRDVIDAAWHVCRHLSISQDTWGEACLTLGRWEATAAVAAVAGRHAAGEVRSPNGLLRRMVELYGTGELRLDRTLRGLMMRASQAVEQSSAKSGSARDLTE